MPGIWWIPKATGLVLTLPPRCNSLLRVRSANPGLSSSKTSLLHFATFLADLVAYGLHLETLFALRSLLLHMSLHLHLVCSSLVWLCLNTDYSFDHNANVYFYCVVVKQECCEVLVYLLTLSPNLEAFRVSLGRGKPRRPTPPVWLSSAWPLGSLPLPSWPHPDCLIAPAPTKSGSH